MAKNTETCADRGYEREAAPDTVTVQVPPWFSPFVQWLNAPPSSDPGREMQAKPAQEHLRFLRFAASVVAYKDELAALYAAHAAYESVAERYALEFKAIASDAHDTFFDESAEESADA